MAHIDDILRDYSPTHSSNILQILQRNSVQPNRNDFLCEKLGREQRRVPKPDEWSS